MSSVRKTFASFWLAGRSARSIGRPAASVLSMVIVLLVADAWVGYRKISDVYNNSLRVAHSHKVLDAAAELRDVLQDAIIGASSFAVSGLEDTLAPYESAVAQVGVRMERLTDLTKDDAVQLERVRKIELSIGDRLARADRVVLARRDEGYEAARRLLVADFKRQQFHEIRAEFADLTASELTTLGAREELAEASYQAAIASAVLIAVVSLTLLSLAVWLARRDLIIRQESEAHIRESEARFRTVVESAIDGIILINTEGIVQSINPAAVGLFGYESGEIIGRNVSCLMPEPDRSQHDRYLHNYLTTHQAKIIGIGREVIGLRKDGTTFPMRLAVAEARFGGRGIFIGFINDISDRKHAEERQNLLIGELRHRVKNLIAVAQSIMTRTMVGGRSLEEARDIVNGRLLALGRAHDLLVRTNWEGAQLRNIVEAELGPFSERFAVSGTDVVLNSSATQTFALALHELATNAAKHGALSNPNGRVEVRWLIATNGEEPRLRFKWRERGGPPASEPEKNGFGLVLLTEAMLSDFDKPPQMHFTPEGFEYEVDVPLAVVVAGHADVVGEGPGTGVPG